MVLLELEGVHVYYQGVHALRGISLRVDEGETVALLGANGAGKSTILRAISRLVSAAEGAIRFAGEALGQCAAHEVVGRGVVHVPEGRRVFATLTVEENLELGGYTHPSRIRQGIGEVYALFPRLGERRRQMAGTLSGGEQQMLAIGRALMAHPRLLLLDEPSLGLAPLMVEHIFGALAAIHRQGTTILLVEQNARAALRLAERAYVLDTGAIVLQGSAEQLRHNDQVVRAYLGEE